MIKYMTYENLGKDVGSLGTSMGSLRINYWGLKQPENVKDKSYVDFSVRHFTVYSR